MEALADLGLVDFDFCDVGMTSSGLVGLEKVRAKVRYYWILSTSVLPQPRLERGVWTHDGVWESASVWYA